MSRKRPGLGELLIPAVVEQSSIRLLSVAPQATICELQMVGSRDEGF
jgi:hypothetical protein